MSQLDKAVAATISELERQNQPQPVQMEIVEDTPRWYSDAERLGLPVVNPVHTGSPYLFVDHVISHSLPNHAIIAKTAKDGTSLTALSQNLLQRFRWLIPILSRTTRGESIQRIFVDSNSVD